MNTFILAFHPTGRSLVAFLADEGYEVWTANLRTQGDTLGPSGPASLQDWCDVDVPAVVEYVLRHTASERKSAVLMGCSLGGSLVYAYVARRPRHHHLCAAVAIGAPLRWPAPPSWARPLLQRRSWLAHVRIRGTRTIARTLLPVVRRLPILISPYMNAEHIDLARGDVLTQTVDDPDPGINADMVGWLEQRDLIVGPTNITLGLKAAKLPLLAIYANRDGIVRPEIAAAVTDFAHPNYLTTIEVGRDDLPFAHADMFINDHAEVEVFTPLAAWLARAC